MNKNMNKIRKNKKKIKNMKKTNCVWYKINDNIIKK